MANLGYTPLNKAGDTAAGPLLSSQSLGVPSPGTLDLTYAGTINPSATRFGGGNNIAIAPALSAIIGSSDNPTIPDPTFFGKQRTSAFFSTTTQFDNQAEEQTFACTTSIRTGAKRAYAPSTAYNVGDNIQVGNAYYRAVIAGTTGANSAPPGTRPTTAQTGNYRVTDGSVTWQWINDGAIGAKLCGYVETAVYPGNGFSEGFTTNFSLQPGADPSQGAIGKEEDATNNSGTDGAVGINALAHWVAYGGSNKWLTGLLITGNNGAARSLFGVRIAGGAASNCAFCIDDNNSATATSLGANYGVQIGSLFGETVTHGNADIYVNTTGTPNGDLDQSYHTFAALSLSGLQGPSSALTPNAIYVGSNYTNVLNSPNLTITNAGVITTSAGAAGSPIVGSLNLTAATAAVELGSTTSAGSPFEDFHSSGSTNDYDARLVASGGTSGTAGLGTLKIIAASFSVNAHLATGGSAPTLSGIAGSALDTASTDTSGTVTTTGTGTQVITFAAAYANPPRCIVNANSINGGAAASVGTRNVTSTALSVQVTAAGTFSYICTGT